MGTFTIYTLLIKEIIMATKYLKALMESGWLSGGDMLGYLMQGFRILTGEKGGKTVVKADGDAVAQEGGKGNTDEHNALIALAEAHFGKSLNDMDVQEYAVTRTRFSKLMAIFKTLREQNKSGGAEKLMHIIGHESHLHGTQPTQRNAQGHKPEGQPQRIELINVRQRTNPAGQLIVRFLTDLETQEAVDLLVATSITDNGKDKTTAAAKAAKDKADETWIKLKAWYGENDTRVHVFLASLATSREAVNRILASPRAQELVAAVESATTPEEKRTRQEAFQAYLLHMVREFQKRTTEPPVPLPKEGEENTAKEKSPRLTLKVAIIGLAIGCVTLTAILGLL